MEKIEKEENSFVIVHFQPLEYYPPVRNFINTLFYKSKKVEVFTTVSRKLERIEFASANVRRLVDIESTKYTIVRYFKLILFNLISTVYLLKRKPDKILYYETWSFLPVYLYSLVYKEKTTYMCHYHEYTSDVQLSENESTFYRMLHKLEKRMLPKLNWISQTNEDRRELFLSDNPNIDTDLVRSIPNYPPKSWDHQSKKNRNESKLKFVYLGSLSTTNMYFKEISTWIANSNHSMDIYSVNNTSDVQDFLNFLSCERIKFHGAIDYSEIPTVLSNYDIGLVLYNGGNLNYVYNAPNKLFEYYSCGLDVWFSNDLISSKPYETQGVYPRISGVDFKEINGINMNAIIERKGLTYEKMEYNCESAFRPLIDFISP